MGVTNRGFKANVIEFTTPWPHRKWDVVLVNSLVITLISLCVFINLSNYVIRLGDANDLGTQ